jgi:L-amino acid N-acyltransferase
MTDIQVRSANHGDLGAILALYNHHILDSLAIWRAEPVALAERQAWFEARLAKGYPVLVATVDGAVAGFASYADFRFGEGYRFTVENSVYVDAAHHGKGIGRTLMLALFDIARAQGLHSMIAAIGLPNAGSVALHQQLGFIACGTLPEIGYKNGQWLDLLFMRKSLMPVPA